MLKNIPLFSCLNDSELTAIEKVAVKKTFPKNTILLSAGDSTDALYVICEGKVKVTIDDNEGKELILSILGTGEYFGEMALLQEATRTATVKTLSRTRLLPITKASLVDRLKQDPGTSLNLLNIFIQKPFLVDG